MADWLTRMRRVHWWRPSKLLGADANLLATAFAQGGGNAARAERPHCRAGAKWLTVRNFRPGMSDSLTPSQIEILRRLREGRSLLGPPREPFTSDELALLKMLGLVSEQPEGYRITLDGIKYLGDLDADPHL